jgi:hypothetical protein
MTRREDGGERSTILASMAAFLAGREAMIETEIDLNLKEAWPSLPDECN